MSSSKIETIKFSQLERKQFIKKLREKKWDLLVIGGGITGAGIALEAVARGLSVAVLEKRDFAFGTSSRSTKLAHGGIRYISKREFGLVREATNERNWLRDVGLPHMTRPTRFLYPILKAGKVKGVDLPKSRSLRSVRIATFLYDFLCGFRSYASGRGIKDVDTIKELEPALESSRLKGAVLWYDSNIDDARLVIETLKEAIRKGEAVALNYMDVVGFTHDKAGRINGIRAVDEVNSQNEVIIKARIVVNAAGIWADNILSIEGKDSQKVIRPTKGVHLIYHRRDFPINDTFAMNSIDDRRFFFAIRRNEWVIVGTTDTDYSGDFTECFCNREDADYLRNTIEVLFPDAKIGDERLQGTYAGLRPLVAEQGKSESDISRTHVVLERDDGLFSLIGGKLTTFRKMAEDLFLKHIRKVRKTAGLPKFPTKKNLTKTAYTIAISKEEWNAAPEVTHTTLHPSILHHLYVQYGRGGLMILRQVKEQPELGNRLLEDPSYPIEVCPWIVAEVDYVVHQEAPLHLEDMLCRRMEISWLVRPEYQGRIAAVAATRMGQILSWSKSRMKEEIDNYINYVKKNSFFFEGEIAIPDIPIRI
ncbi:MAG: glycerol-3-phosphate dehydrogenase/oxidase [Promethearchaeota archaeon]